MLSTRVTGTIIHVVTAVEEHTRGDISLYSRRRRDCYSPERTKSILTRIRVRKRLLFLHRDSLVIRCRGEDELYFFKLVVKEEKKQYQRTNI